MKLVALILFLAAAGTALQTPPPAGRRDWIEPATGHRVIRISDDPGSSTLYFHDNAFSAAGDRMMLRTPKGVAVVEVAKLGGEDLKLDVVAPQAGGGYFARRGRDIYLSPGAGNPGQRPEPGISEGREHRY
jgi:oligogalacturonide lyase